MEEIYKTVELPANVPGIGYTLRHRKTVELLIEYYCKRAIGKKDGNGNVFTQEDYRVMINRGKCHDMDKVVTSLAYPQLTADYFHRMFNGHHFENIMESHNKYDLIETIFDIESGRYTKKDKGNCAFDFLQQTQPQFFPYILPLLQLFDLDKSWLGKVDEVVEQIPNKVYETDLIEAILVFIHTTHIHLLEGISRIDDEGYMKKFNAPVPYRHKNTQKPGGTVHKRPNQLVASNPYSQRLEMMNGTFQAEVFDYDAICKIPVSEITHWNKQALNAIKQMGREYQR